MARNTPLDTEIARLRSTHEYYDVYVNQWFDYITFYEGGKDLLNKKYIFKHTRENDADYTARIKRSHNLNYCSVIVDFYTNFIFAESIEREGGTDETFYREFVKNVNKKGDTITDFMRTICTDLQVFGMLYILVDTPELNVSDAGSVLSKQQAEDHGLSPYWILMHPDEILDWITDDFGSFIYLKRCQDIYIASPTGGKRRVEKYTEWTGQTIKISYVDVTNPRSPEILVEWGQEKPNLIGLIPVCLARFKKSKKYRGMGNSFLKDIVYNNREVLNLTSLIDEYLYRQCVIAGTLIDCPRNLEKYPYGVPIKELVDKEFLTYTWLAEEERFTLRRAHSVRKTGNKHEVWRLTYAYCDEYNQVQTGYLDATPSHPILLQTGEYIALRDLKPQDKLVPFNSEDPKIVREANVNHEVVFVEFLGYEDVYNMVVDDTHNFVANGIVVKNCFNILAKEKESLLPMVGADEGSIGTSNLWEFPQGGKPPVYISPPSGPAEFLQQERANIVDEIYRQATQDLRGDLANGSKSSGFSQAQSFSKTVPFIAERADTLEELENKLMGLTFKYLNKKWSGKVSYKDDYSITNITDAMTHLLMLFKDLALPSETFAKAELIKLAQMLDNKLPQEEKQKVTQEINDLNFSDWSSSIRSSSTSPAAQQKPKSTGTIAEIAQEAKVGVGATNKLK